MSSDPLSFVPDFPVLAETFAGDTEATATLGRCLGRHLQPGQALALVGSMGAGKTCLARGVAVGLGVDDPDAVASPTYLLVVEHPGPVPMVHMDAWLPDKTRGFLEDGGVDYLAGQAGVLVVEWADRLRDLLPAAGRTLWLHLQPVAGGRRAVLRGDPAEFPWVAAALAAAT